MKKKPESYTDEEIMRALMELGVTIYETSPPRLESDSADVVGAIWLKGCEEEVKP